MTAGILNAADYGVPQRRKRAIVLASRIGRVSLPTPTHCDSQKAPTLFEKGLLPWETVGRAIGNLVEPVGTEIRVGQVSPPLDLHFGRTPTKESLARYRCIPEGGNRFDLQKKRLISRPGAGSESSQVEPICLDVSGRIGLPLRYEPSSSNRKRAGIFTPNNTDRLLIGKPPACSPFPTALSSWEPRSRLLSSSGMPSHHCWRRESRKFSSNTYSAAVTLTRFSYRGWFCG